MPIRNFCIIAHIDHGKSTLADRMIELTSPPHKKKSDQSQQLDTMDLEQERGITIKMTPVRMQRKDHEFNLIDTPGHADFQYEVSRSLAAVEGVILLVDASQGIQAQTLSTLYMAMDHDLEIIPVLNKIDLPAANPQRVGQEIENMIGIPKEDIIAISAKTGENVQKVLDAVIQKIPPPPRIEQTTPTRALIFDSVYDPYQGVLVYIKVVQGTIQKGMSFHLVHSQTDITPSQLGYLRPHCHPDKQLTQGQIGYLATGQKSVRDAQIGDTLVQQCQGINEQNLKQYAIAGFKPATPFVYAGVYPLDSSEYDKLKLSFEKLLLNDSAIEYSHENSKAMGFGFRCGFLGLLHMDIIRERLRREFGIETIFTTPTVSYIVKCQSKHITKIKQGTNIVELVETELREQALAHAVADNEERKKITDHVHEVDSKDEKVSSLTPYLSDRVIVTSGAEMMSKGDIEAMYEPIAEVEIVGPEEFTGNIMQLVQNFRAEMKYMEHVDETRIVWKYYMPMGEMIIDFYDQLKSVTKGFATMNYEFATYQEADLVKLDLRINEEVVEAFSLIVHESKAYNVGKALTQKLKTLIPRHLFPVPLQASVGNKIIARETIPAVRKDVTSKCYGGDITRKKKLLKKQKEGKKKMKSMGNVSVPPDVFVKMVTKD